MLEAINIPEDYELLDLMDDVATSTTTKADSVEQVSTDKATEAKSACSQQKGHSRLWNRNNSERCANVGFCIPQTKTAILVE